MGGELQYEHIAADSYRIMLTLYADCSSTSGAFQGLYSSNPYVVLLSKNGNNYQFYDSIALQIQNPIGQEITPLCPSELSNSACNGGSLPGIRKFRYEATVALPAATATNYKEWSIEFWANQDAQSNYIAGRSTLITNISMGPQGVTFLNLRAYLNRSLGANNSPTFTSDPAPFFCINKPQIFNIGAVDADGDNLSYYLVPGLTNKCQSTVNYNSGLSATKPLITSPNAFNFNSVSGQLDFTPSSIQNGIVVYEIREYKNGQLVGTSMREMSFVVLNNCNNNAPASAASSNNSNVTISGQDIYVCAGTNLQTTLNISDPDQDNVTVNVVNLPSGMSSTVQNNGGSAPSVSLNWNNTVAGTYVIYINLLDDGCPLAVRQTVAYTIHVLTIDSPTVEVIEPTNCVSQAKLKFGFPNISDYGPINVEVKNSSGSVVKNYTNITTFLIDSLAPGSYSIQSQSVNTNCVSDVVPFTVVDSGIFPYPPQVISPVQYCLNDVATAISATNTSGYSPTSITYVYPSGATSSTAPTPSTSSIGQFQYSAYQQYKSCKSDPATIDVYVSNPPGNIMNLPNEICQYDTLLLQYGGPYMDSNGVEITWSLPGAVVLDSGSTFGQVLVTFPTSGVFLMGISAVSEYGCSGLPFIKSIEVLPSAFVKLLADSEVCTLEDLVISNTEVNFPSSTYTWDYPSDAVISTQNSSNLRLHFTTPGMKTISLTAANTDCSYTDKIQIMVHPKPSINLEWETGTVCYGDTVTIRSESGAKLEFYPSLAVQRDFDSSHIYYAKVFGAIDIDVVAISDKGCRDTANLVINDIKDCCKFFFPNAFTPNGDGLNDRYEVWAEGNPKFFDLQIFNRYGQQVFSTLSQYNTWDGRYQGKDVDMGYYFYIFEGECYEKEGPIIEKGDISLLR